MDYEAALKALLRRMELRPSDDGGWDYSAWRIRPEKLSPELLAWWRPICEREMAEAELRSAEEAIAAGAERRAKAEARLAALSNA